MSPPNRPRGWLVAATRSGAGKTTVTLAILAALRRRGVAVAAAKSGPDYIDPMFHAAAAGAPGVNLDSWAMPPALIDRLVARAARDATLLVVESAMGLFDGVAGEPGRSGAAADLAARFGLPVLLVLDVSGQSQSAAAVAGGFARHRSGRARSAAWCSTASPATAIAPLRRQRSRRSASRCSAPSRATPRSGCRSGISGWCRPPSTCELSARLDATGRHGGAEPGPGRDFGRRRRCWTDPSPVPASALPPPGQRIALAQDAAFSFVYPHVLRGWRDAGAKISAFSPLADAPPPPDCDVCWLPGGYPELHAAALAAAGRFRAGLAEFAERRPVHGECGGYMVLGAALEDADGVSASP